MNAEKLTSQTYESIRPSLRAELYWANAYADVSPSWSRDCNAQRSKQCLVDLARVAVRCLAGEVQS